MVGGSGQRQRQLKLKHCETQAEGHGFRVGYWRRSQKACQHAFLRNPFLLPRRRGLLSFFESVWCGAPWWWAFACLNPTLRLWSGVGCDSGMSKFNYTSIRYFTLACASSLLVAPFWIHTYTTKVCAFVREGEGCINDSDYILGSIFFLFFILNPRKKIVLVLYQTILRTKYPRTSCARNFVTMPVHFLTLTTQKSMACILMLI